MAFDACYQRGARGRGKCPLMIPNARERVYLLDASLLTPLRPELRVRCPSTSLNAFIFNGELGQARSRDLWAGAGLTHAAARFSRAAAALRARGGMVSDDSWLLIHAAPALGALTANAMFAAPLR